MSAQISLNLKARLEALPEVDRAIEKLARSESWSPDLEFQIRLVLDELSMNIVSYGCKDGGPHEIEVEVVSMDDRITIGISDDGIAFDPLNDTPEPDTSSALEDRRVGGLGVHLVRTMVDEAHYRREGGRNRMTLVKQRKQ